MTLSLIGVVYLLKKRVIYLQQVVLLIVWAVASIVYYVITILKGVGIEPLSSDMIHSISLFLRLYGALSILALVVVTAYLKRPGDE
jgi:hypothetical protein